MFILMPCATIKDNFQFSPIGQIANQAQNYTEYRNNIKRYSDVEYLLKKIQEGEVIMTKKVQFDQYLKSQVDLMRAHVQHSVASPFSYSGYMNPNKIITSGGMGTKEQWAIEMVFSRYNICSIYHAAAYGSLEYIFLETGNSYKKNFKESPKFINNLQVAYKYFNEGYQPLKRLGEVYDTLQMLLTPASGQIIQMKKQIFCLMRDLIGCNLAYLKLEKYRLMTEYRSCKELSYAIHMYLGDAKKKLKTSGFYDQVHEDLRIYLDLAQKFFLCYAYYFLLEEHQDMKKKEQYGFIKKQFQAMIVENSVICEEFIKTQKQIQNFPGKQNLDNVMFAVGLTKTMLEDVQRKQYAYGINIHENKMQIPKIQEVVSNRISPRNIWQSIAQF